MIKEFQKEHRFLSNFYPSEVWLDGITYPTVEHAYQAAKTMIPAERGRIQGASSPGKAKIRGREITLRLDLEDVKVFIMTDLVTQKFTGPKNFGLREQLLATGDQVLQEGNLWHDTFWGVDLRTGKGENRLGKILMEIRKKMGENDE